jgi:hypothetical protein
MAIGDPAPTTRRTWNQWFREWLATLVVVVSIVGVATLSTFAITHGQTNPKEILTMVLPMIGTWVGTVLAFYFGREQLEAATRSVTAIASQLTPDEKLRSVKVVDKMIPRSDIYVVTEDPASVLLLDSLAGLRTSKKGNRLPVLSKENHPKYVVHRSTIDGFLANAAAAGKSLDDLKKLTLDDLLKDAEFGPYVVNTVVVLSESATLADAKQAMEAVRWCQDAMITRSGTANEPVTGWVTNVIVEANSKV